MKFKATRGIVLRLAIVVFTTSILMGCQKIKDITGIGKGKHLNEEVTSTTSADSTTDENEEGLPAEEFNPEASMTDEMADMTTEGESEQPDTSAGMVESSTSHPINPEEMVSIVDILIDGATMYNIFDLIDKNIDQTIIDKIGMTKAGVLGSDGVTLEEEYKPTKTEEVIFRIFTAGGSYKDYKVTFKLDLAKVPKKSFKERNPHLFKWSKGKHQWRRFAKSIVSDVSWEGTWDGEQYVSGDNAGKLKDISNKPGYSDENKEDKEALSETSLEEPSKVDNGSEITIGDKKGKLLLKNDENISAREDGANRAIITVPTQNTYEISMISKDEVKRYEKESLYDVNNFDFRRFTISKGIPSKKDYGSLTRYKIKFQSNGVEKEYPYFWVINANKNVFMVKNLSMYEGRDKELDAIADWLRKGK